MIELVFTLVVLGQVVDVTPSVDPQLDGFAQYLEYSSPEYPDSERRPGTSDEDWARIKQFNLDGRVKFAGYRWNHPLLENYPIELKNLFQRVLGWTIHHVRYLVDRVEFLFIEGRNVKRDLKTLEDQARNKFQQIDSRLDLLEDYHE